MCLILSRRLVSLATNAMCLTFIQACSLTGTSMRDPMILGSILRQPHFPNGDILDQNSTRVTWTMPGSRRTRVKSDSEGEQPEKNPNLDGDYVVLLEIRKRREHKRTKRTVVKTQVDYGAPVEQQEDELQKRLFEAVGKDDLATTETIESHILSANKCLTDSEFRDPHSNKTALHHAIECKSWGVTSYFIQRASDELFTSSFSAERDHLSDTTTCLHQLVQQQGTANIIQAFLSRLQMHPGGEKYLEKRTMVEVKGQRPRDMAAIHMAACRGDTKVVELLIDAGADVNTVNQKNDTALLWAARFNHMDTARYLLSLKPDVDIQNDKGSSALYWAVRYGHRHMVKLLLDHGANTRVTRLLGFETVLVLASALGNVKMVKLLLEHGAQVHRKITGGDTAIHVAAAEGNEDVIPHLIAAGADVNANNDQGMTPLLFAAKNSHEEAIQCLVRHTADVNSRNKMGQTAWYFAVTNDDTELLVTLMNLYREKHNIGPKRKVHFENIFSPLHCAAEIDNVAQIRKVLALGADYYSRDLGGNTFLHTAAQHGCVDTVKLFMSEVDPNMKNNDGDTVIHLACKYGQLEVTKLLLTRVKLSSKNSAGETPLHVAVRSDKATKQLVQLVLNMMVKANSWSLLNERDIRDNTALHVAARYEKEELMEVLDQLSPSKTNYNGENPFHTAVRKGHVWMLETMLKVFSDPKKGFDIDQKNDDGETLLHLCSKQGEWEAVELLLNAGADLEAKDHTGNTTLHDLVQQTVDNSDDINALMEVFKMIINKSTLWWCRRHEVSCPADEDSEPYQKMKRTAVLYLMEGIPNNAGLSVSQLGSSIGAVTFMEALWNLDGVFRFRKKGIYTFDICDMTLKTLVRNKSQSKTNPHVALSDPLNDEREIADQMHCTLDYIVHMENEYVAAQMLKLMPLRVLVEKYWHIYQWIYAVILALHIIYMSCYSIYAVEETSEHTQTTNLTTPVPLRKASMFMFLLWPIICLTFELTLIVLRCRHFFRTLNSIFCSGKQKHDIRDDGLEHRNFLEDPTSLIYKGFNKLLSEFTVVLNVSFCVCVILWYIFYTQRAEGQIYCLAISLTSGWLRCISLAKAFQTVSSLIIALKYIIIRDISRFFFIYFFVLMAFTYAFHVLLQIPASLAAQYAMPGITMWTTYGMMIGFADLEIDSEFDSEYEAIDSSSNIIRATYIIYVTLSNVILLNILIGMLSATYDDVNNREATTWTVHSTRMALRLEHAFSCIPNLFSKFRDQSEYVFDEQWDRWFMTLPIQDTIAQKEVETDETVKSIHKVQGKLDTMEEAYEEMYEMVEEMHTKYDKLVEMVHQTHAWTKQNNARDTRSRSRDDDTPTQTELVQFVDTSQT